MVLLVTVRPVPAALVVGVDARPGVGQAQVVQGHVGGLLQLDVDRVERDETVWPDHAAADQGRIRAGVLGWSRRSARAVISTLRNRS